MRSKNAPTFIYTVYALCLMLLLQSCGTGNPGIYKNEKISSGRRDQMHALNTDLLAAFKANSPGLLESLLSQEMIADRAGRVAVSEQISIRMKSADYSLLSEYYIINKQIGGLDTITENDKGINSFELSFNRREKEMYIALFTPKTATQKWLITATYCKFDYGWKIANIEFLPYAENGKTAPELMEYAKQLIQKGYYLDGSNTAAYAINCLRPSAYWKYANEDEIYNFNTQALNEVKAHHPLPITIKQVPTQPFIWRIKLERTPEGTFPNINYISKINLLDTMALRKENEAVCKAIGQVMPGVDKDKKYIFYTIYNQTAKGVPFRDHYDLRQKL